MEWTKWPSNKEQFLLSHPSMYLPPHPFSWEQEQMKLPKFRVLFWPVRTNRAQNISNPVINIWRPESFRISSVISNTYGDTFREECWSKLSKNQRQSITLTGGIRNSVPLRQGVGNVCLNQCHCLPNVCD